MGCHRHDVGERRQFVDHVNAARKELHGALTTHALESGLANDYAKRSSSLEEAALAAINKEIEDKKKAAKALEEELGI